MRNLQVFQSWKSLAVLLSQRNERLMDVIIAWRRQQLHCSIQVSERERVFLIVAEIQVGHCIRCLVREHIDGRFTSEGTSHAVIDIENNGKFMEMSNSEKNR